MIEALPCIVCGKQLKNVTDAERNQPYEGLAFTTHGHYGSTVFDPMTGQFLEINICDKCLVTASQEGKILVHQPSARPVRDKGEIWTVPM